MLDHSLPGGGANQLTLGLWTSRGHGIFPAPLLSDAANAPPPASPRAAGEQTLSQSRTEGDHDNVAGNSTHANSKSKQAPPGAYRPDVPIVKERTRGSSTTAKLVASDVVKLLAAREDLAADFFVKTALPSKTAKRTFAEELATLAGHEEIYPLTEEVVLDVAAAF